MKSSVDATTAAPYDSLILGLDTSPAGGASSAGPGRVRLALSTVVVTVVDGRPRVLTVVDNAGEPPALPSGYLEDDLDLTLEAGARRVAELQGGPTLGYVEQLYTFGDRHRDPDRAEGGMRVVAVAYFALVRVATTAVPTARMAWQDVYACLPWEDWRSGRPALIERGIGPALAAWVENATGAAAHARRERADIAFGLGGASWDGERVLERFELLFEVGLVAEAFDQAASVPRLAAAAAAAGGVRLALDHRRILATALGRLRGKIKYRPVVFELLPEAFTLLSLQHVVEALAGVELHKANFRRIVEQGGLVDGTGLYEATGGRPAELFRFRREVLRERLAPGVGIRG